jgi:hypothetical protein
LFSHANIVGVNCTAARQIGMQSFIIKIHGS